MIKKLIEDRKDELKRMKTRIMRKKNKKN